MTKKVTSIKLTNELKTAVLQDMKKRGITSFSRYVEVALINELNKNSNKGTIIELQELQQIISEKINDLTTDEEEVTVTKYKDMDDYLEEVKNIQEMMGHVTEGAIKFHAKKAGVCFEDFLKALTAKGIVLNIID